MISSLESVYCYECNSNWAACTEPLNTAQLQYNLVPCSGSCFVYTNPNDRSDYSFLPNLTKQTVRMIIILSK